MKTSMTNAGTKMPMARKGRDGAIPAKPGFAGKDGTGMGEEGQAMTDGGAGGPAKGKGFGKKYDTATMSQAMRRRKGMSPIAHTVD